VEERRQGLTSSTESLVIGHPVRRKALPPPEVSVARQRWRARAGRLLLSLLIIAAVGLALTELLTPAVGDAPSRVMALDAAHHSHPVDIAATDRIAMATVAVEDERFYSHHGIDTLGLVRAAWGGITGSDLGGSTIDQQLAKTLYTSGDTGLLSRLGQAGIALKLEGHYSKIAILSMYLDAVYYGHGYYGIAAASAGYFGVTVTQLTWSEAALLAGLPQAPSLLDPYRNLVAAQQRQH
jgi:membrane peptidoglycan carboxypeptidase